MYSEADLGRFVAIVRAILIESDREKSHFIKRKYSSEPFYGVARLKIPALWT
jgi:hypothetical protein